MCHHRVDFDQFAVIYTVTLEHNETFHFTQFLKSCLLSRAILLSNFSQKLSFMKEFFSNRTFYLQELLRNYFKV
jgi:hypothetical protein